MLKSVGIQGLKLSILCSTVGLLLSSLSAEAQMRRGTKDGGGGGAYVCEYGGKIIKTMFVDLFESAEDEYEWADGKVKKLKIIRTDLDPEIQFENAMQRLSLVNKELAAQVRKEKNEIFRSVEYAPDNVGLPKPLDLETGVFPILTLVDPKKKEKIKVDCKPSGMMFYQYGKLIVKKPIMDKLETKTDLAAAWAHEAIYKVFRDRSSVSDGGSMRARRLVGCLFSGQHDKNNLPNIYDDACLRNSAAVPKDRLVLSCSDANNEIILFPTDKNVKSVADTVRKSSTIVRSVDDIENVTRFRMVIQKIKGIEMNMGHMSDIRYWTPMARQSAAHSIGIYLDNVGQRINEEENQSELSTFFYNDYNIIFGLCFDAICDGVAHDVTELKIGADLSVSLQIGGLIYKRGVAYQSHYNNKPNRFSTEFPCRVIN